MIPTRKLPQHPDLDQLRRQAKELLAEGSHAALHDAQLELARSYGFPSWPKLKAFVDGVTVTRLADAVRAGDVTQVRALLERRPEVVHMDMAGDNEHRAIHYAVLARSPEMVRLLMEYGSDARKGIYPHRDATSALTIAKERGYEEIVAIIEDAAPPVAAHAGKGAGAPQSPLTNAVLGDDTGEVARLLDSGLDPNEPTRVEGLDEVQLSSGAPLWHCARLGKYAMAEMLLQRGADPNAQVYASGSALFTAYGVRDWTMVELLRRYGGEVDAITAGLYRETDLAKRMLAGEIDGHVEAGMFAGETLAEQLLWAAACGGDPEIVRLSLERVDWPSDDPRWHRILEQPLRVWNHLPGHWQQPSWDRGTYLTCFRLVLDRTHANLRGRFGRTLLHDVAAFRKHMTSDEAIAFATTLLDAGARLDVRDDLLRSTPLGWACRWGHAELVRLFIARGADVAEPDAEPWATPRAWAEKMGYADVLRRLN